MINALHFWKSKMKQKNGASTMKSEKSCGAIVLSPGHTNRKVLLIKHENGGHWAFPKGHVENDETEVETALREIKEETGLDADLSTAFRKSVSYSPAPGVMKEVVYFIAFAHTETIEKQDAEVTDFAWMPFNEALQAIT
jgi:bis(5'-nucleosidyl)-tetraphosphatase